MESGIPTNIQKALDRTEHPYHMWDGIQSIPDYLNSLLDSAYLAQVQQVAEKISNQKYLDLIGCGTSLFAAMLSSYAFGTYAGKRVDHRNAFESLSYPLPELQNSALIGISHTGGTPVVVQSVDQVNESGGLTVGLTDVCESRLAKAAQELLCSGFGPESALAKTRSFMTTVFVLYLLALFTSKNQRVEHLDALKTLKSIPEKIRESLDALDQSVQAIVSQLPSLRRVIYIGAGPQLPIAMEGSLKLTECALMDSTAWELEEAAHGTWAGTKEGDLIVILGMQGPSLPKSIKLAQALRKIKAKVWILTDVKDAYTDYDYMTSVQTYDLSELYIPFFSVLPLYQFAYRYAISQGLNPDSMNMSDPNYLQARTQIRESF